MQIGFYFDQSRCIGCYACVAACRSWNQLPSEYPDLIQIISQERGKFPNVSLSFLFLTCFHCEQPACIAVCPSKLFVKRQEDGVVLVADHEKCTNCQLCVEACPYGALKIVINGKGTIMKCNFCIDRISKGLSPTCVNTCPTEALDAGLLVELSTKYGKLKEVDGFPDFRITKPSIVFRSESLKKVSPKMKVERSF